MSGKLFDARPQLRSAPYVGLAPGLKFITILFKRPEARLNSGIISPTRQTITAPLIAFLFPATSFSFYSKKTIVLLKHIQQLYLNVSRFPTFDNFLAAGHMLLCALSLNSRQAIDMAT